jgi:hypothetical protein
MGFNNKRLLTIAIIILIPLVLIISTLMVPIPGETRTSTNSCAGSGCHEPLFPYEMFLSILSYNVPATIEEEPVQINCTVDISGNWESANATERTYFANNITVTAKSTFGYLAIQPSSRKRFGLHPNLTYDVNFTAHAIGNGSDVITFTAEMEVDHGNATAFRTQSQNVPTQAKVYVPPTLSNGQVTPASGSTADIYTFEVTYTDTDGDQPTYVTCTIDGSNFPMVCKDGNPDMVTIGEVFTLDISGVLIGEGTTHQFNFSAHDFKYPAIGDLGTHNGPDVVYVHMPPVCSITFPVGGMFGGLLNITGVSADPDPVTDVTLVEVSLNNGPWFPANGTDSWMFGTDLNMFPVGPLSIRARAYNGTGYSGIDEVDITVNNSFSNSPPNIDFELSPNTKVLGPLVWINGSLVDPELPAQAITVLVGSDQEPKLEANITQMGSLWTWSIQMDLGDHPEGNIEIYAIASDPFASSPLKKLPLILEILNKPPSITFNHIPDTVWGPTQFSGDVIDPEEALLSVYITFDLVFWELADVTDGKWGITYNVSALTEETHTLYARADDGENQVTIETSIEVLGPYNLPVIIETGPKTPFETWMGTYHLFFVIYRAGDHRGVNISWYFDNKEVTGVFDGQKATMNQSLKDEGEFQLKVVLSNEEDRTLNVSYTWDITVLPVLTIGPKGSEELYGTIGEAIVLEFECFHGEAEEVAWYQEGTLVCEDGYITFVPDGPGVYNITVEAEDQYGNEETLTYTIIVEDPNAGKEEVVTDEDDTSKTIGAVATGVVLLILCVVLAVGVVFVVLAIRKVRKKPKPGETVPGKAAAPQAGLPPGQGQPQIPGQPMRPGQPGHPQQQVSPGGQQGPTPPRQPNQPAQQQTGIRPAQPQTTPPPQQTTQTPPAGQQPPQLEQDPGPAEPEMPQQPSLEEAPPEADIEELDPLPTETQEPELSPIDPIDEQDPTATDEDIFDIDL